MVAPGLSRLPVPAPRCALLIAVSTFCLAGGPAAAVDYGAIFSLKDQSVYAPGDAIVIDTGPRRLGPAPFSAGDGFDFTVDPCPIDCTTGVRAGAEVRGDFGLTYAAKFNSGSFDALYPVSVRLDTPADFATVPGTPFVLASSFAVAGYDTPPVRLGLGGRTYSASLQTHSPTLEAYIDLNASFYGFVGAQACVAGFCGGPALGPLSVNASRNLAAFNRNGDGLIRIGDTTVELNQYFTELDGNLTGRLTIPNIDATSSAAGGSSPTRLVAAGRDNVMVLAADVGNMVSKALGIPLSGNAGGIGYDLLSINAGLAFDLQQTVEMVMRPFQTFTFLSPVRRLLAGGVWSDPTLEITVPLGDDLTLRSGVQSLAVIPKTTLVATLSNVTSLVVQGDFSIQALAANIYGETIGPLFDSGNTGLGRFEIPLYETSFDVGFGSMLGSPFNVLQSLPTGLHPSKGFRAYERFLGDSQGNPGFEAGDIEVLDLDCPPTIVCRPAYYATLGPSRLDALGLRQFIFDGDTLELPANNPGLPGSDASQLALLAGTGYRPGLAPLDPPAGDPNPFDAVPEPASWTMLIAGFGLIGAAVRRRRASTARSVVSA
jgi:hypothetical protein